MSKYFAPVFEADGFHCIFCGLYAAQWWADVITSTGNSYETIPKWRRCLCSKCHEYSLWYEGKLVFPAASTAAPAHEDLPDDCKDDYEEARRIVSISPKASAALMRLVIQKLMKALGESGDNINNDIRSLVAKGLPPVVQMALDFCRVVGNNAVHPGEIDLNDTPEVAHEMFHMVNFIVDDRIAKPKQVAAFFERLPEGAKQAIEKRDGAKLGIK